MRLVVSDAHEELKAARRAVLGGIPWQCCQFHLQQNASAHVLRQDMKAPVVADIHAVFSAKDRADALLRRAVQRYKAPAPKLAAWLKENLPEGLAVFAFPEPHRHLLRTTNGVERVTPIKPQPRGEAAGISRPP